MRDPRNTLIASLAAVLAFGLAAMAQMPKTQPEANGENSKWMYNGRNRVEGSGGPAPVRDLSGTWAGPRSTFSRTSRCLRIRPSRARRGFLARRKASEYDQHQIGTCACRQSV